MRVPTLPADPNRPPICLALLLMRVGGRRWTFKQVAAVAGISPRLVSAYERGAEPLSRETLDEIGAAMGFTPEEIELALVVGERLHRHGVGRPPDDAPTLPPGNSPSTGGRK